MLCFRCLVWDVKGPILDFRSPTCLFRVGHHSLHLRITHYSAAVSLLEVWHHIVSQNGAMLRQDKIAVKKISRVVEFYHRFELSERREQRRRALETSRVGKAKMAEMLAKAPWRVGKAMPPGLPAVQAPPPAAPKAAAKPAAAKSSTEASWGCRKRSIASLAERRTRSIRKKFWNPYSNQRAHSVVGYDMGRFADQTPTPAAPTAIKDEEKATQSIKVEQPGTPPPTADPAAEDWSRKAARRLRDRTRWRDFSSWSSSD